MKYLPTLLFLLFISCDFDVSLKLKNNSDEKIAIEYQVMNIQDSILDSKYCDKTKHDIIGKNGEKILRTQNKWELSLKNHPEKILRVFIINKDSLDKYGLCKIYSKQIFSKRFDLTYEDLEKMKWIIIYE
jgi:hypothetical protein